MSATIDFVLEELPGAAEIPRLQHLAEFLARARETVRFVDYRQAERDCEELAVRLLAAVPPAELRGFEFAAVPRGGLIVLGMLAYALDLGRQQLTPSPSSGRPLVVVDDCALTGRRTRRELRRLRAAGGRPEVVAHLYSSPELRRALAAAEPDVRWCLAARDLADRSPEVYPDPAERARWRQDWRRRLGEDRYWIGLPDLVAFAWSEPDRLLWNPVTERVEDGWRFVPAERCLKNRSAHGLPPRPRAVRRWRPAPTVVAGRFDDGLLLHLGRTDRVYRLQGIAAEMWLALAAWGDPEAVVEHLGGRYEVAAGRLATDLARFTAELAARGLLLDLADE